MEYVRARVAETYGFALRSEIRLIGFDDAKDVEPGVDVAKQIIDVSEPGAVVS